MMTEKPRSFERLLEDFPAEQTHERVPDALEVATREAARRQARQVRWKSRRDRQERPANSRTTRRREHAP